MLVRPRPGQLDADRAALRRGRSPENLRPEAAAGQLAANARDPAGFLAGFDDPEGRVPRLPSLRRWIWKAGFYSRIDLLWQPGTEALPPTRPGHVGHAVMPRRRGEGLAAAAPGEILPLDRAVGRRHVDLTLDPENRASIRVMQRVGAVLIRDFVAPAALGGGARLLLYRLPLAG